MNVIFSKRALRQITQIERYITRVDSYSKAVGFSSQILARCERIALAPYQGTLLVGKKDGVRKTGMNRRVVIIFRPEATEIRILSIAYGGKRP